MQEIYRQHMSKDVVLLGKFKMYNLLVQGGWFNLLIFKFFKFGG
ncbi:hypothetical protein D047_1144 [Vibrio parahaemolyticus VPTS-2010_2]|nr:hypothetical protein D049_1554 [Vibrio parahaemolyticus VPTS-2010]EXJ49128.1 hypothetical protein D047_1144 [Vibrio parahaemolyticus VPTS-2010_2]